MRPLEQQIRRARRRLTLNILLDSAAWGVLAGAGALTLTVLIERLFALGVPLGAAVGAGAGLAAVAALAGTLWRRVTPLAAAVALDEAAGLHERLSTALLCRDQSDPFVRATEHDADRIAQRVRVPAHLPLRRPHVAPWSGGAVALALAVTVLMPQFDVLARDARAADPEVVMAQAEEKERIVREMETRVEQLESLKAKNPALADLDLKLDEFQVRDHPDADPEDLRREAVRKIDSAADKLEQQRETGAAAQLDAFKQQLARLDALQGDDAAAQLSQALARGDMKDASAALQKLQQKLAAAQRDPNNPQAQAQSRQLAAKLDQLAKRLDQLGDTKQLRKELQRSAGLSKEQAETLMKKLADSNASDPKAIEKQLQQQLGEQLTKQQRQDLARKISQQQKACQACKNLGQSLAQAAKACQAQQSSDAAGGSPSGGQSGAGGALSNAVGQLSDMEMAEQLANDLELQLSELDNLRNSVCQQGGAGQCQGGNTPGMGMGRGIGAAPRPDKAATAHDLAPVAARGPLSKGAIIGQILVDSPATDESATAEVKDAVAADYRDAQNAIERNQYPRQYHNAIREYFERYSQLGNRGR